MDQAIWPPLNTLSGISKTFMGNIYVLLYLINPSRISLSYLLPAIYHTIILLEKNNRITTMTLSKIPAGEMKKAGMVDIMRFCLKVIGSYGAR
jgi:hypothetical protein